MPFKVKVWVTFNVSDSAFTIGAITPPPPPESLVWPCPVKQNNVTGLTLQ